MNKERKAGVSETCDVWERLGEQYVKVRSITAEQTGLAVASGFTVELVCQDALRSWQLF